MSSSDSSYEDELPSEVKAHLNQRFELNHALSSITESLIAKQRFFDLEECLKHYLKESRIIAGQHKGFDIYLRGIKTIPLPADLKEAEDTPEPDDLPSPLIQPSEDSDSIKSPILQSTPRISSRLSGAFRENTPPIISFSKKRPLVRSSSPPSPSSSVRESSSLYDAGPSPVKKTFGGF
ncbi:hypothetical protein DSO57_1007084 [Entomophthora muscae]|uniref:Uncharacterized protein n=1 Tax=Entomophthora muscae TaxID=34485 RepID=A0ACC2RYN4_9FUNG|nr:hypothetical protein DSO57_1007084 [Entomophthora muscae]